MSDESIPTVAFGVHISLLPTERGGRASPLHTSSALEFRFRYRPNWGLPGMRPPDQSAAWVFSWSRVGMIHPGQSARAVIVPPLPFNVPRWADLDPGTELPMYEGHQVVGRGHLLWRSPTGWPLPFVDEERFSQWLLMAGDVDRID